MTPERFRQIRSLFDAALEREPAARASFLDEACHGDAWLRAEVDRLLEAHQKEAPLLDNAVARGEIAAAEPARREVRHIDRYEILRELGRGGMGVVYLARRTDGAYPRQIALKVLRPDYAGPDVVNRFRQEQRILASLDHPNVARLLDGGKTPDGLPYYVMEYVEGVPIHEYCDRHRLDVKARLALFRQVCAAVDSAHRKGVIHRDLKPSNILVKEDGTVKLLDFGIAKLVQPDPGATTLLLSVAGARPMTPEYASPEQIQDAPITPASDVYSLGVVLYELLTGRPPYRLKNRLFHELLRVVCDEEPAMPSEAVEAGPEPATADGIARSRQTTAGDLRRQLAGDLDSIVLKALRKEPWQRYRSAAEFSEDLGRHLDSVPVDARSSKLYRVGRLLHRRRGWLAAGAIVIAALASGGIRFTWPAFWTAIAVAGVSPIWWIGADAALSRRIAQSEAWRWIPAVGIVAGIAIFGLWWGKSPWQGIIRAITSWLWINCLFLGLYWWRWVWRSRWAGSRILDASVPARQRYIFVVMGMAAFGGMVESFLHPRAGAIPLQWAFSSIPNVVMFGFLSVLEGRLELCQRGIIRGFGFHKWRDIESYAWRTFNTPGDPFDIDQNGQPRHPRTFYRLILNVHRVLPFLPSKVRIWVTADQQPAVDAALSRYLSDWPG